MNPRALFPFIVFISVLYFYTMPVRSQISEGGTPLSFVTAERISSLIDTREFPAPDMDQILREDEENLQSLFPSPERMGVSVLVNLDMASAGTWEALSDGTHIWRLTIISKGALALGVYYDQFYLPEGARLFLYNKNKDQVIGAFTSANNHESGLFATEFVQGDEVTLEYSEPAGNADAAVISISEVAYVYRNIMFAYDGDQRGGSWYCMVNFACPEGIGWEDQSRGIARMSIKIGWNYYLCSGSLINNTSNNRVPYFLSAEHCGTGASSGDMNQWVFYFNYQATTCTGTYGNSSNTVVGCALKASDPLESYAGADFLLVQLNSTPPSPYNVYYNGWNRTNVPGESGVCIHHPNGDIKKISTYLTPMVSSTWWNQTPSHWRVTWSQTVTNLSVMQGGSSGSPIFDQDKLIMGDLSGGYQSNSCENPSPAWYGKIWYAWDLNGTTPATRLKDWLDPTNTGVEKQPGISSQVLPPVVDFEADNTQISQGEYVHFTDLTTGNPATSWSWEFPGGTPASSTEQNPMVLYLEYGDFDVTLTVTNPDGTDTETKEDYITVDQVPAPVADFSASAQVITEGESVSFTDLSLNDPFAWSWTFEGGDPDTSYQQNPGAIVYYTPGVYDVSLTVINFGGSSIELKEDYITVNAGIPPTADFYADVTEINTGDSVNFFDLSTDEPNQWLWTFEGGTPAQSSAQNPTGIVYNTEGAFNVQLRAKNAYGFNIMLKEEYILVGNVSIKDIYSKPGMTIYPNPSQGLVSVRLSGMEAWGQGGMGAVRNGKGVELVVVNSLGYVVWQTEVESKINVLNIDLSDYPNGLYVIRMIVGDHAVQKKISILR